MKRSYLLTILLMLFLYGDAAAQQNFLVVHDDKNDPCRRFKMRILTPVGLASFNPSAKKPVGAVDYKMRVWNPCQQDEPQIALLTPSSTTPDKGGLIFSPKPSKVRFPFFENRQKKRVDFLPTEPPPFFNLRRRWN
jgi:hypothetical protein